MNTSLPINDPYQTDACWLAARRSQARSHPLNLQTTALAITPRNLQRTHSHRPACPLDSPKTSLHPSRPDLVSTADLLKSP